MQISLRYTHSVVRVAFLYGDSTGESIFLSFQLNQKEAKRVGKYKYKTSHKKANFNLAISIIILLNVNDILFFTTIMHVFIYMTNPRHHPIFLYNQYSLSLYAYLHI